MKIQYIMLFVIYFASSLAYADCIYDGESYPEGTVIGPFTCTDGVWE